MRKFSKKQYIAAGAAAAIIIGGAGAAFAYWSSTGTGNGSATTGTSSNFTVTVDNLTSADLTPGGPSDTVNFTVTNPSSGVQKFTNAVASVTGTTDPGCTAADFDISGLTVPYGNLAANATANGSFTLKLKDTGVNQDACKGVTVNLEVDAS